MVVIVAAMVVIFLVSGTDDADVAGATPGKVDEITTVPAATLEAVGLAAQPLNVNPLPAGVPAVEEAGKPVVLYYGAEFCPFCAVQRWPATIALSRFGTFEGLEASASAPPPEILPNTPTVTYTGSTYTSDYITLSTVETATRTFDPLETPTDLQRQLFETYNVEAVTGSGGGIPFMMIGNLYAWAGSQYDPGVLAGKDFDEIVDGIRDPATELSREVGSAANYLTAMICELTGGQPADVCSTPLITQAQAALPGA
ncbi:MAG: DUF929 family protein [Acidimicrobiia bacterium]|nr:DUF929 family protein [Acidimicrobiia bacterium]